ncbi:GMC family oxidoreductase [Halomonas huangheensis]|uniref:Glucose-methanol-choline oxidoreductase n=1 Tax=Halomonas huangheensis TaxID=1178482 RepID=W1N8T3_9GAMM|nr:GMC family oxidoreductase [Halomonas huangheensis]ALM53362.1 glucose-methanol-choline oxidoreductase [Halomonas huangheensis]ERL51987.1 glucose-methanol-choline oxidoreductase [Halomonas huangheensis]
MTTQNYDLVIVGSGVAGSIVAYQLGSQGKKVLILEAGQEVPADRSDYMETFFKANAKTPESPYPPTTQDPSASTQDNPLGLPDPAKENTPRYTVLQIGAWRNPRQCYFDYTAQEPNLSPDSPHAKFAFASSYERIGGGTTWHWLGTCLRLFPHDFELKTRYGQGVDWPGGAKFYDALVPYYEQATQHIGVSGDKQAMDKIYSEFGVSSNGQYGSEYDYPMPGIDPSQVDNSFNVPPVTSLTVDDIAVSITPTPQGRNSLPGKRRQCAGNTNCIPICPIQAKYDATVTLAQALQTGNVDIRYRCVASNIRLDDTTHEVSGIDFITYDTQSGIQTGSGTAVGKKYYLAAHAIETPKLLLMSNKNKGFPKGVANSSDQVGRNLMDHIMYLAWGLAKDPVFPYRGPLSTSGVESLRDGKFRSTRSAYRIEIGNEGWQWAANDPFTTLADFVFGQDASQTNGSTINAQNQPLKFDSNLPDNAQLFGAQLVSTLNGIYTRQVRLGYLIEQLPDPDNRVELSESLTDHLGLPRPKITYRVRSDYERNGFVSARKVSTEIFQAMGAREYTTTPPAPVFSGDPSKETATNFEYQGHRFTFYGAGHIVGTYRMGDKKENSVVNVRQQSWDHTNLYMGGSGLFPTVATGNPTLTIAALAFKTATHILEDFS